MASSFVKIELNTDLIDSNIKSIEKVKIKCFNIYNQTNKIITFEPSNDIGFPYQLHVDGQGKNIAFVDYENTSIYFVEVDDKLFMKTVRNNDHRYYEVI